MSDRTHRVSRRRRVGFTLVELLVVIGIIAILISVLLPTLASARRSAYKVKCASQLREIGNALKLYSVEYKGYWPVVVHNADTVFPADVTLRSNPARNDYWYQFLLKYFTNRAYTNAAGKRLADFQGTPLWGCPAVDKGDFQVTTSSEEFNSGYGMSMCADFTQSTRIGSNAGSWSAMISPNGSGVQGKYYKMTGWLRPAEKVVIADSRAWTMETRSVNDLASIVHPNPVPAAIGYDGLASHQFDRWRHSKKRGGTNPVSMNALFVDGHVTDITSLEDAFKGVRLHFPK